MRKNEHPRCGCKACRTGSASAFGKYIHRAVNRKIRHDTKMALLKHGVDFVSLVMSTPYTD